MPIKLYPSVLVRKPQEPSCIDRVTSEYMCSSDHTPSKTQMNTLDYTVTDKEKEKDPVINCFELKQTNKQKQFSFFIYVM